MSKQCVDLRNVQLDGTVLDIGGGGEGIVSRHAGESVVAIDRRKDELEETPNIGLKIVMDATDMKFLDNTFDHATCFYSLMYMNAEDVEKCIKEAFRVLRTGGCLWIWDTAIPEPFDEDVFVVQLEVTLKRETISTGFGIGWGKGQFRAQSLDYLSDICTKVGFRHVESAVEESKIFLRVQK